MLNKDIYVTKEEQFDYIVDESKKKKNVVIVVLYNLQNIKKRVWVNYLLNGVLVVNLKKY